MTEQSSKKIKKLESRISKLEKKVTELEKMPTQPKSTKTKKKSVSVASLLEEFKDEGFFDKPRSLKDIKNELANNNYHYSVTSLTNPLQRLVRQRIIGRLLQNGKWAYVKR